MKLFLILLFFFSYLNVSAKTIITPYIKVGEVDSNYQLNDNEKLEKVTYYKQEKIDKKFKYLESPTKEYSIKTNELKYGKFSNYQKERLNNQKYDEDIKTIYSYQDLKKINSLTIKNVDNILITNITLKYQDEVIYQTNSLKNEYKIKLTKLYSPIYLTLELTCFLNQEELKGKILLKNSDYINEEIKVKDKGINRLNIKLINCLAKTIYDKDIKKASHIDNEFYINIISKKVLYRYREKYYKCYKKEEKISTEVLPNYKVIDTFNKYYLYRKEIIEVYDDINLDNYLDLNKIIKTSTIDINKLDFYYNNNCSTTPLTIKYQGFKTNIDITFNCENIPKSKVTIGKTKSFQRELFGILFKTIFLKKL